jgi:hypothetical protein
MRFLVLALVVGCEFSPRASAIELDANVTDRDASDDPDGPPGCEACGIYELVATADAYLRAQFPNDNYGSDDFQRCGSGDPATCCTNRAIYQFDLAALPPSCVIEDAELRSFVFQQDYQNRSTTLAAHRVTAEWVEGQVGWNRRTSASWSTPGGDFDPVPVASTIVADGAVDWVEWDLTTLAIAWRAGTVANHGVIVIEPNDLVATQGRKRFRTREAQAAQRPHLRVTCGR